MPTIRRGPVTLAYDDVGRGDPPVVLLHGLAGYAGEWAATVHRLSSVRRVLVPDQRGHGRSTRHPDDVSRAAYVDDVVALIEEVAGGPVVLVGQSLGGHTALLVASRRPDLAAGLVVAEATPARDPDVPARVRQWLGSWPVPFASPAAAADYFTDQAQVRTTSAARAWAAGLGRQADGWRPRFDVDIMVASLDEVAHRDVWDEWSAVRCPALVVRGDLGTVPAATAEHMAALVPGARAVTIAEAGHDLHLDQPDRWAALLAQVLTGGPDLEP